MFQFLRINFKTIVQEDEEISKAKNLSNYISNKGWHKTKIFLIKHLLRQ